MSIVAPTGFVFGDSFAKIFMLCRNKNMTVKKFKGATMKGLSNPNNKNRQEIQKIIKNSPTEVSYLIFNFGQVDYNFSVYYKLVRQEPFEQEDILKGYFEWIDSLPVKNKMVINIYPSPLSRETICGALVKYNIMSREAVLENRQRILLEYENQVVRQEKWTKLFKEYKKKYEMRIAFMDLTSQLTTKGKLKEQYIDINPYNIHLRWGPLIKDLQKKFAKYLELQLDQAFIDKQEKEYEFSKHNRMNAEFKDYDYAEL